MKTSILALLALLLAGDALAVARPSKGTGGGKEYPKSAHLTFSALTSPTQTVKGTISYQEYQSNDGWDADVTCATPHGNTTLFTSIIRKVVNFGATVGEFVFGMIVDNGEPSSPDYIYYTFTYNENDAYNACYNQQQDYSYTQVINIGNVDVKNR